MGMDFRVNEYGEIIREDNELFSLEQKYLKGVPLNIEVRKRLAVESQNLQVLEACLKERAITVRRIVWDNPNLTPEMRMEATRQKLIDKSSAARGYAQQAMQLAEEIHGSSGWELDTILQEKGNCHLYEKMGYKQTGETKVVNERMTLVFYHKE